MSKTFNPETCTPRQSLVLVRLLVKTEEQIGVITVPTDSQEYTEALVLAVGPDPIQAAGGVPSTADLQPGQTVLVQHKRKEHRGRDICVLKDEGVKLRYEDDKEGQLYLFEQANVLAILTDPTPFPQRQCILPS